MLRIARLSLALIVASLLAACGATAAAPSESQSLTVTTKEFSFAPAQITIASAQPVELTLQNAGAVEHDWSVREIDLSGKPTTSGESGAGHMAGDMHDAPKLHIAAAPGAQGTLSFVPSKPGTYEFYCTVAGHKEAGMVGTLTVKGA